MSKIALYFTMIFYKKSFLFLIPLFTCFCFTNALADSTDYYNPYTIRYENFVYRPNIKSVLLEGAGAALTDAAIELNSGQQLRLSFDELDAEIKDYSYTLIHCDMNWQPSNLNESQYLKGFSTDKIIEYRSSTTAYWPYVHYEIVFPNEIIQPAISGNYILKVFDTNDPDSIILTKRFLVYENKVEITSNIHAGTFADKRFSHHEIDFVINSGKMNLINPYNDLQVVLLQNNRWDNAIRGLKPRFVNNGILDYNYEDENAFDGGNEFRNFDIKSIRYQSEHIKHISMIDSTNHFDVELMPDARISSQKYALQSDINGKYLIKHDEGTNSAVDGDYMWVHFQLKMNMPEPEGNLYVLGALTNWRLDDSSRMTYVDSLQSYIFKTVVKQGYYNYQYAFVPDGGKAGDVSIIEGNHFETENEYAILVYYSEMNKRYDQLIGVSKSNSKH